MRNKNIVGMSAHFHDAACCVMRNGEILAAVQEERLSRVKHDPGIPKLAFRYCLTEAKLDIHDVDCIGYYENPTAKAARQLWTLAHSADAPALLLRIDPARAEHEIRECLGYEGPIRFFDHHRSHAASAFFFSGFPEAAVMTMDGVGEWNTGTYGYGRGTELTCFEEVRFPHSLGLLYSTITDYLGFSVNDGEYKVMGLAPYGYPIYLDRIRSLVETGKGGQYRLQLKYFDFQTLNRMYSDELPELLGGPARVRGTRIEQFHQDIACSLQRVLEEILLEKVAYLYDRFPCDALCLAGGVALNCVANGRIRKESRFRRLFVQPAANDAGCALGAAALAYLEERPTRSIMSMRHDYLGPSFTRDEVRRVVEASGIAATDFSGREEELMRTAASLLADGKVVGWFQGRMEFGPRSLGARSILADPRNPGMRGRINALVKKREAFRPFAPAVWACRTNAHFDIDHESPFMLETCQVRSKFDLPATTHVDGSARVQTVSEETNARFARLLAAFEQRTGCPILLNTSFNMSDEPIVASPADAVVCFLRSEIDALILEDFVMQRDSAGAMFPQLFRSLETVRNSAISDRVYAMF